MNRDSLDTARAFAEAVGWKDCDSPAHIKNHEPSIVIPNYKPSLSRPCTSLDWLLTGDGMLAVKAEMVKRDIYIFSGPYPAVSGTWQAWVRGDAISFSDSEPCAVLRCAVNEALKGKE